ncbi:type VII secretion-associated serine protease mycosin [Streptomyces sp. WL006]|uniref:type VII secretion-associated serine protease mycosin n=1 Tax=Streptomyces sp. WL006 TaxID=3423915 RepID=UPI003F6C142E
MRISRQRAGLRPALAAFMGLVLTGAVAAPAQAETAREQQWHLDLMRADEMWKTSTGKGVTIAVIDTGVDEGATNLRGQVLDGVDYSSEKGDEHTDWGEHGTVMAALIAGTGAGGERAGAYGLAPGSKILPIRMPKEGEGVTGLLVTPSYLKKWAKRMARAIRFAADSEAKVINISMASPGAENPELSAAVKYALDKGKLIFAGVGNSGDVKNELQYPAATPGVIGVAGVDRNAKPYKSSQWGPQVDLAAPAVDIVSTCPNDRQVCKASGTSNASALASASAALLWSQHPDWTNYQVLRVLLQTASGNDKGLSRDDVVGYGVVRPRIALTEPGDPGPADEYPLPDLGGKAAESASPEASEPAKGSAEPTAAAAAAGEGGEGGGVPTVGIAVGVGAAVLLGGAAAVWAVRRRRSDAAPTGVTPAPPYGGQSPYPPSTVPPPHQGYAHPSHDHGHDRRA